MRRQDGPGPPEARRADARRRAGGRALMAVMPMLPELGLVALVLALLVTLLQAVLPLAGAQRGKASWMAVARPAAFAQMLLVLVEYVVLPVAFVMQDFSVRYVAENSNSLLPLVYRYTAVWGSHEGSLLMWPLILAVWTAVVASLSRKLPEDRSEEKTSELQSLMRNTSDT